METTTQLPAVTQITDVTNAIDVFFYDVAQSNSNQAVWWNSVSKFFNNIIDAVKSGGSYFLYVIDISDAFITENYLPVCVGSAISIALFFMIVDYYRGR